MDMTFSPPLKDSLSAERPIAYFSMEIAVDEDIPTYAGGLGVLAGDTLKAAADLGVPVVGVTLLHRQGYFRQRIDSSSWQIEDAVRWPVEDYLKEIPVTAQVHIEGRPVTVRAWCYEIHGSSGYVVPIYFLDAELPQNSEFDRSLTGVLYGKDLHYRLCQEVILGIGGVRILRALGLKNIQRFHMNEGHSSLLALELLDEHLKARGGSNLEREDVEAVRKQCVFTTHTPVPAGHDKFDLNLVHRVLGDREGVGPGGPFCWHDTLNMTYLALTLSRYVNGVAKKHGEVARQMFADYRIDSITNGVHVATWASGEFQKLFDTHIPGWREDNFSLRYAMSIPREEIWDRHEEAKHRLVEYINRETNSGFDRKTFTVGFARRMTAYKRPALLLSDIPRLQRMATEFGGIQIVFSGKAHPHDDEGKSLIRKILDSQKGVDGGIRIVFLENYEMSIAKLITAGVDLWVNTPEPPLEASGTSGMKAALNGVPSLSVLDGWWIEGCIEGVTGWAVGELSTNQSLDCSSHAESLYHKLEATILPLFYRKRNEYVDIMRHAIALNGSFFNTQRMVQQYVQKAYY